MYTSTLNFFDLCLFFKLFQNLVTIVTFDIFLWLKTQLCVFAFKQQNLHKIRMTSCSFQDTRSCSKAKRKTATSLLPWKKLGWRTKRSISSPTFFSGLCAFCHLDVLLFATLYSCVLNCVSAGAFLPSSSKAAESRRCRSTRCSFTHCSQVSTTREMRINTLNVRHLK